MTLRLLFVVLFAAPAISPAGAQVHVFPPDVQLRPIQLPAPLTPRGFGPDYAPSCMDVYLNETNATGFYVPVGANVELADDLHTTAEGVQSLCAFDLGYFKPTPGPVNAVVTFYDNTAGDVAPGPIIAGPFQVQGLPDGANAFRIEVPGGFVDADIWMGVAFDDNDTGLLTFSPATLGFTHDVAWLTPPGESGNFGGNPPADFFLGVSSSPTTEVRTATWGGLKVFYR